MLGRVVRLSSRCFRYPRRGLSSVFDLSRDPSHWPKPLKSCSCGSLTSSDLCHNVTIAGWVSSIRVMKDSVFIVLRDGSGMVQTLFCCDKDSKSGNVVFFVAEEIIKSIPLESSVCVTGIVAIWIVIHGRSRNVRRML